jgi:hypothetical protein
MQENTEQCELKILLKKKNDFKFNTNQSELCCSSNKIRCILSVGPNQFQFNSISISVSVSFSILFVKRKKIKRCDIYLERKPEII